MTELAELQQKVTAMCLGPAPSAEQFEALGDARIWSLYREMIQNRLRGELKVALRRSYDALGEAAFEALFVRALVAQPPRSRPFHGVVGDFAAFAVPELARDASAPAWAADLLAYEAAQWAVGDMDDRVQDAASELSFDAPPVFTPARRLLVLEHAVHEPRDAQGAYRKLAVCLCVYRRPEDTAARTFVVNATVHALLLALEAGPGSVTLTEAVRTVAAQRKLRVDQAFIDGLCTVLADFVERGLLLGSKA